MKRFWVIVVSICQGVVLGDEPAQPQGPPMPVRFPHAPRSWLGLEVSKPDASITAHIPSLPPGIGFVVRSIDKNGPAEKAGIKEFDVLWKLGDQMLVNEAQLAALLRLGKPGDEVVLTGFRAGQPLEIKLKLGVAPDNRRLFPSDLVEQAVLPGRLCGGPRTIIRVLDKTANFSSDEGRMELRREGEVYWVRILNPQNTVIVEGELPKDGNLDAIPVDWKLRVDALRRGLEQALDGRMMSQRIPRPRVVPPEPPKP